MIVAPSSPMDSANDSPNATVKAGQSAAEGLSQQAEPAPGLVRAVQVGQHVAGVAGAQQAGHVRPECDEAAEPLRRCGCRVLADDPDTVGQRNAVAAEQLYGVI